MKTNRLLMINNFLQQLLGKILQNEVQFPKVLLTITEVKTAPDLYNAKVFVSIYGPCNQQQVLKKINLRAPYLQHLVSQQCHLRRTPKFTFVLDPSLEQADHINQLLTAIKK